jgi:hypothetical protein
MNQKWQCRGVSKIFDFAFAPIFNLLSTMHGKCHAQDAHQFIFEPEELSEARISPKHHGAKQRSGRFLSWTGNFSPFSEVSLFFFSNHRFQPLNLKIFRSFSSNFILSLANFLQIEILTS